MTETVTLILESVGLGVVGFLWIYLTENVFCF